MNKKQLELVKNGGLVYKGSRPDLDNLQKEKEELKKL